MSSSPSARERVAGASLGATTEHDQPIRLRAPISIRLKSVPPVTGPERSGATKHCRRRFSINRRASNDGAGMADKQRLRQLAPPEKSFKKPTRKDSIGAVVSLGIMPRA